MASCTTNFLGPCGSDDFAFFLISKPFTGFWGYLVTWRIILENDSKENVTSFDEDGKVDDGDWGGEDIFFK